MAPTKPGRVRGIVAIAARAVADPIEYSRLCRSVGVDARPLKVSRANSVASAPPARWRRSLSF